VGLHFIGELAREAQAFGYTENECAVVPALVVRVLEQAKHGASIARRALRLMRGRRPFDATIGPRKEQALHWFTVTHDGLMKTIYQWFMMNHLRNSRRKSPQNVMA
jgi:hypothetical protein